MIHHQRIDFQIADVPFVLIRPCGLLFAQHEEHVFVVRSCSDFEEVHGNTIATLADGLVASD